MTPTRRERALMALVALVALAWAGLTITSFALVYDGAREAAGWYGLGAIGAGTLLLWSLHDVELERKARQRQVVAEANRILRERRRNAI